MNRKLLSFSLVLLAPLLACLLLAPGIASKEPAIPHQGQTITAFSYQGYLTIGEEPADGSFDFAFELHNASTAGSQIGETIALDDVVVAKGQFAVQLDFGDVFDGTPLWLQIGVSSDRTIEPYNTLAPRQALRPAPNAIYASKSDWSGLSGVPAGLADGDDDTMAALSCSPDQIALWNGAKWMCANDNDSLAILQCSTGQVPQWSGSAWACDPDDDTLAQLDCSDGQIVERLGSGWACGQDDAGSSSGGDITGVYGGEGLIGGGPTGEITITVDFAGDGSAATVARSDHAHDAIYYTESELQTGTASVHWGNLTSIPAGINDGDDDTLAGLNCATGWIAQWSGSAWVCDPDDDSLGALGCTAAQFPRWNGATWVCSDEVGDGDTLAALTCAGGEVPQWNGSAWVCDPDDDSLGALGCTADQFPRWNGVTWVCSNEVGDGDTLSTLTCAGGEVPQWNGSAWVCDPDDDSLAQLACSDGQIIERFGGGWICGQDDVGTGGGGGDITGVYAGEGLAGGGPSGEITITVAFEGDGSAATVARSDHTHDASYYTKSELQSGSASVHWGNLTNIPVGIADGDDDALAALACASGQVAQWNGTDWNCDPDDDTLAGLVCAIDEVARWNDSAWVCTPDIDSLGALICEDGQVAKYDELGAQWVCGLDLDTIDDDVSFDEIAPIIGSTAGTVASGDHDHSGLYADFFHNHDIDYYTITALQSYGGASVNWGNLFDVPSGLADGDDDTLASLICNPDEIARWDGGAWQCTADYDALTTLPCSSGQIPQWDGLDWVCTDPATDGWSLTGNSGTVAGTNFLGTNDNVTLTLAVSGTAALRLAPTTWSPNLIGGSGSNTVRNGVFGATIGGGASTIEPHQITEHFATIGGGTDNTVGDNDSDLQDARYGTVSGGAQNTASGVGATVGGGVGNTASNVEATVGGGYLNLASGYMAAIGGGMGNVAGHFQSTVAGGLSNLAHGNQATIGGGEANRIITSTQRATISGGAFNVISETYGTIGGGSFNVVSGTYGTISGGGPANPHDLSNDTRNKVTDDYGVVGGGGGNQAGNNSGDLEDAFFATVGGGRLNLASGVYSTVGGGANNIASNGSAVAGGINNRTYDEAGAIAGGWSNSVYGHYSAIGGGANNVVSSTHGTISGGVENYTQADGSAIGGGRDNWITGAYATIGGGDNNIISGTYGTIAGGGPANPGDYTTDTRNKVSDDYGVVGGGGGNQAGNGTGDLEDAFYATVGGGRLNLASGAYSTVGGGANNIASNGSAVAGGINNRTYDEVGAIAGGWSNSVYGHYSAIGGGANNVVSSTHGTISGGVENYTQADGSAIGGGRDNWITGAYATIGGGDSNIISGTYGTIAGGGRSDPNNYTIDTRNRVSDDYGTIGGGGNNFAGDGDEIITNTLYTTIGGGYGNVASGNYATVPGGNLNAAAGISSFAAGSRARANHSGSFVWADTINSSDVTSDRADQFKVRAWGGSYFEDGYGLWVEMNYTALINTSSGTYLDAAGVWHSASDRSAKENFEAVDGQQVLDRLAEMPVTTWNYKTDDESVRHIGPVAQDMYAAFGFGDSTTTIGTIDADGISMAAIQALYARSQELESENSTLQQEVANLEARLVNLETIEPGSQGIGLIWVVILGVLLLFMGVVTWVLWRTGLIKAAVTSHSGDGR